MHPTQQDLEAGARAVEYELLALINALRANRLALRQFKLATNDSAKATATTVFTVGISNASFRFE